MIFEPLNECKNLKAKPAKFGGGYLVVPEEQPLLHHLGFVDGGKTVADSAPKDQLIAIDGRGLRESVDHPTTPEYYVKAKFMISVPDRFADCDDSLTPDQVRKIHRLMKNH